MEWNTNLRVPFVPRPDQGAFSILYNYNFDSFPAAGMEGAVKHPTADMMAVAHMAGVVPPVPVLEKSAGCFFGSEKKKRMSSNQLELLENSFEEEIKLDPDRKMKLARDLGLQPRQVAVWFQNRRARWKAKQLERLYEALKQELDAVSREKLKLQEEVLRLKAMLMDQQQGTLTRKQASTAVNYTEISGDQETVESTSAGMHSSSKGYGTTAGSPANHQREPPQNAAADQCHYMRGFFNVVDDEYNTAVSPSYWAALPSYPSV